MKVVGLEMIWAFALVLAAGASQAAETLPDPTRPPASFGPLGPVYGEEPEKAPPPQPVLQSVILSATRKVAIIGGQTVNLGEKFGDAKLIRLTPSEAVLRTAEGEKQVLKLFPDAEKKLRPVPQDNAGSGSNKRHTMPEKKLKQ